MKKIKIIFMLFIFIIAICFMSSLCYAENELELISYDITAPTSGIYGVGTEITFTMKFNQKIKGTMPKLEIYFGNSRSDGMVSQIDGQVLDTYTDTIIYKYTIKAGDNGKLNSGGLVDAGDKKIEAEDGSLYILSIIGSDFSNTIYADTTIDRSDLSNATFEVAYFGSDHCSPGFKVKNGNAVENNEYYIHLSHNKNEKISVLGYWESIAGKYEFWEQAYDFNNDTIINNSKIEDLVAESGDIYIWICEVDKTYRIPKILVNGQKVTRKEQFSLGNRIKSYFFSNYTSSFCNETYGHNDRKVNLKIGRVTDNNILKSIQKGESNCLQKLLDYAKSSEAIYTGTVNLGDDSEITSSMNIYHEKYYYVYMQLEDENGKYYPIEDISLYQGCVGETVGKNLFDYLSDDFKWNLSEDNEKSNEKSNEENNKEPADPTIAKGALPDTGSTIYTVAIILFGLVIIGFISYRKNKNIKIK